MFDDPIVAEIRNVREAYAAKLDFDLAKIVADLQSRQGLDGRKVVRRSKQLQSEQVEQPVAQVAPTPSTDS